MRWSGAILILGAWLCAAAGCVLPKYSVAGRSADGGDDAPGAGGQVGAGTGGASGSGGASADAGIAPCPPAPTALERVWDFATANQGFVNEATIGSMTWISTDGCPASGALDVVAQVSTSDDTILIDTSTQPAVSLVHKILSARVKLVKGSVSYIQLFAKTGPCAIYSDGARLFLTAGSGWQLVTLDPANLEYFNDACFDPVQCVPDAGASCYDAGDVTELGIVVTVAKGQAQTLELEIDTVGYGQ